MIHAYEDSTWLKIFTGSEVEQSFLPESLENINLDSISVLLCIHGKENDALNLIVLCTKRYICQQSSCHKPFIVNDIKHAIYNNYALEKYLYVLNMEYNHFQKRWLYLYINLSVEILAIYYKIIM